LSIFDKKLQKIHQEHRPNDKCLLSTAIVSIIVDCGTYLTTGVVTDDTF
jgi:hypothetical protein